MLAIYSWMGLHSRGALPAAFVIEPIDPFDSAAREPVQCLMLQREESDVVRAAQDAPDSSSSGRRGALGMGFELSARANDPRSCRTTKVSRVTRPMANLRAQRGPRSPSDRAGAPCMLLKNPANCRRIKIAETVLQGVLVDRQTGIKTGGRTA